MKITQKQLRRIIREEINRLRNPILESAGQDVELTDPGVTRADISRAWPGRVTHNGRNVYEVFYSPQVMGSIHRMLQDSLYTDAQEVYLGYSPSLDKFYMGFDVFEDYEDEWGELHPGEEMSSVVVELLNTGKISGIKVQAPSNFYSIGIKQLKSQLGDVIDVRLD